MRFLFRPVSPFHINQGFYENRACINIKNSKDVITCDGLNPPKGYKSLYGAKLGHGALDLRAKRYTPIYSSQDGIVTELADEPSRGLGIGITTKKKFPCKETGKNENFKIRYWHNALHKVRMGDEVHIGDLIAWADNTGNSSGDHVHFDVKPVKITYNKDKTIKSTTNILQNNGYFGSVDPLPYMREENAVRLQGLKSAYERLLWAISL